MKPDRYNVSARAYYGISELYRQIKKDLRKPEFEAAYQKWKAEQGARHDCPQSETSAGQIGQSAGHRRLEFQPNGTVVVWHSAQEIGAVGS